MSEKAWMPDKKDIAYWLLGFEIGVLENNQDRVTVAVDGLERLIERAVLKGQIDALRHPAEHNCGPTDEGWHCWSCEQVRRNRARLAELEKKP